MRAAQVRVVTSYAGIPARSKRRASRKMTALDSSPMLDEMPYGIEAVLRDVSGGFDSMTERRR